MGGQIFIDHNDPPENKQTVTLRQELHTYTKASHFVTLKGKPVK